MHIKDPLIAKTAVEQLSEVAQPRQIIEIRPREISMRVAGHEEHIMNSQ
jgi:hypothetical protein